MFLFFKKISFKKFSNLIFLKGSIYVYHVQLFNLCYISKLSILSSRKRNPYILDINKKY